MFYVGQKVVCVDDTRHFSGAPSLVTKGKIYTISAVFGERDRLGEYGIDLAETPHPPAFGGIRQGYRASRFRPVVERKTSIEIFKAMLNPSREGVSA